MFAFIWYDALEKIWKWSVLKMFEPKIYLNFDVDFLGQYYRYRVYVRMYYQVNYCSNPKWRPVFWEFCGIYVCQP